MLDKFVFEFLDGGVGDAFKLRDCPDAVSFLEQGDGVLVLFPHLFVRFAISFLPAEFPTGGNILGSSTVEPILDVAPLDVGEFGEDGDDDACQRVYGPIGLQ